MSAVALLVAGGGPGIASAAAFCPPVRLSDGTLIPQGEKRHLLSLAGIEEAEEEMLRLGGDSIAREALPVKHLFSPGIYIREIFMPAGAFVIGAQHLTEHFNIALSGRASVIMGGEVHEIIAPSVFVSRPNVRKVLQIHSDMRWITTHANPENITDIATLESRLITMSAAYLRHFAGLKPCP